MKNATEQTITNEELRLLTDEEIADTSGAAANCWNGKKVFDIGWLALELIHCDDGSMSYGVVTRTYG